MLTYCWQLNTTHGPEVARSHKGQRGLRRESHNASVDISNDVLHDLDEIVVSFVYLQMALEKRQKDMKRQILSGGIL
jgi:hypothetical protein